MRGSARWFWFVLALAMHLPVAEAQQRITSGEFAEWQAFYNIEPFGDQRADLRAGIVASTVAAVFAGSSNTHFSPADFMLFQDAGSAEGSNHTTPPESLPPGSREETRLFLDAMGATNKGQEDHDHEDH